MNTGVMPPPGDVSVPCADAYGLDYNPFPGVADCPVTPEQYDDLVEGSPASCGDANAQAFVVANFGAAAQVAAELGISGAVGDSDILALSALESGWGGFAGGYPGAWFGMQGILGAQYYAGETDCVEISKSPKSKSRACEMEFSSFGAAAQVFASNKGSLVQGVSDPTQFFTNLHTRQGGFAQGSTLQAYLYGANGKPGALATEAWVQSCLTTLGLVQ
jgi:hypothetical protein